MLTKNMIIMGIIGGLLLIGGVITSIVLLSSKSYELSFDTQGGSSHESIVINKDDGISLPIPSKDGYTFVEWFYLESDQEVSFTQETQITKDTTLYARWEIITYVIDFETNSTIDIDQQIIEHGDIVTKPNDPDQPGYQFIEWYKDEDLSQIFDFTSKPNQNLTLYAKWDLVSYQINYHLDGGDNHTLNVFIYDIETDFIKLYEPTKTGSNFLGWYKDSSFTEEVTHIYGTDLKDMDLYAKWDENHYPIYFETNGGTLLSTTYYTYLSHVEDFEIPQKEGYTFIDWYIDDELSILFDISNMPDEAITVYAKWEINTYDLSFETFTEDKIDDIEIVYQEAMPELPELNRVGYTFVGWYMDDTFLTPFSIEEMPAYDITLYANYEINTYDINYYHYETYPNYVVAYLELDESIEDIFTGYYNTAFITSFGRVLVAGTNDQGQIGDPNEGYRAIPHDITEYFNLTEDEKIIEISYSLISASALTSEGRVFTWGDNSHGTLANGSQTSSGYPMDVTEHFNLTENEKIVKVTLGMNFGIALTSQMRIFTWGNNDDYRLGNQTNIASLSPVDISDFYTLQQDESIISIDAGYNFGTFLTSNSRVYVWGANQYGQLGVSDNVVRMTPVEMTGYISLLSEEKITMISANMWSMGILTNQSRVFTWGYNASGNLADSTKTHRQTPVNVTSQFTLGIEESIKKIEINSTFSTILTSLGRLYMVGSNTYGQLGDGTTFTERTTPIEILSNFNLKDEEKIINVYIGAFHTITMTTHKRLFGFGLNDKGQLSIGSSSDKSLPEVIPFNLLATHLIKETYDYNELIEVYTYTRAGYHFQGWYLDKDRTTSFIVDNMPAYDIVLFDYWTIISYSINYHLNGGDYVLNYSGYNITSEDIEIKKTTKSGYLFDGWYDNPEFTGEPIEVIRSGSYGDLDLYAKWILPSESVDQMLVEVGEDGITYVVPYLENDSQTIQVSGGYQMAQLETTYELWYVVRLWAEANGYHFEHLGREGYVAVDKEGLVPQTTTLPVTAVSWYDTIVWLNALSEMSGLAPVYRTIDDVVIKDSRDGNISVLQNAIQTNHYGYRLPTSAEWEMAARWKNDVESVDGSIEIGGRFWTPGSYGSGAKGHTEEDFHSIAWFYQSFESGDIKMMPVGTKLPNALGIYDMTGNVSEWVFDVGANSSYRVVRGGSSVDSYSQIPLAKFSRYGTASLDNMRTGFRIVLG